jgi:hypothetical protein
MAQCSCGCFLRINANYGCLKYAAIATTKAKKETKAAKIDALADVPDVFADSAAALEDDSAAAALRSASSICFASRHAAAVASLSFTHSAMNSRRCPKFARSISAFAHPSPRSSHAIDNADAFFVIE